ncbi:MAG: arsenate reductase family protein [Bacteroidales bacterium]|nr:arsenate reductase family protein [Bacteroidales bacterium]MBN2819120.1 arsenate reductase family protein [Bacteroidales bacterium]
MYKVYHNPRCKKSREGLEYLKSKTQDFEIVEYLKDGLKVEQIKEILLKTNLKPTDLIRTQEDVFKKQFKGKNFNNDEWIDIIIENPKLLQRPIIVGKQKAVLAQPAEKADEILK